ncbi:hypothetical protein CTAYLR_001185 [Chrysophaeum taylorii]|uniref:C2 domain-containing protein n=1 Tax=Chrysophaeum taylorii TaxID=2483200 RepID=A0AAD7XQQ8_9STRA|nr:hypothetical protein CTAYLR_001185 [Chrysophaeum taylorii]
MEAGTKKQAAVPASAAAGGGGGRTGAVRSSSVPAHLKRAVLRRERSNVLISTPAGWDEIEADAESTATTTTTTTTSSSSSGLATTTTANNKSSTTPLFFFASPPVRRWIVVVLASWWFARSLAVACFVGAAVVFLPDATGLILSTIITRIALFDRVSLEFKGVRVWPWVGGDKLYVEVRVKAFKFGNPKGVANWCREAFVSASDIELVLAIRLEALFRIREIFEVWSWFPRHQALRPGRPSRFAAVYEEKRWRNRRMLGTLEIDLSLGDVEVAFERSDGALNSAAISGALARGELERRGLKKKTEGNNKLTVEVIAARDLLKSRATFAKVSVRQKTAKSKTVVTTANPVFALTSTFGGVADPSTVIHVALYDEGLRDVCRGQWASSLKELVISGKMEGWVPLRDHKMRVYEVRRYKEPIRVCSYIEPVAFTGNGLEVAGEYPPDDDRDASIPNLEDPGPGYPAVKLRIRWEHDATSVDPPPPSTMDQMKANSTETALRCGNLDNIRLMLASFPLWLEVRGFRIRGTAIAHVRDLFLTHQGELERKRRSKNKAALDDYARDPKRALALSRLEVAFPREPLTLDQACGKLARGLLDRALAISRVGTVLGQIVTAIGYGALHHADARPSSSSSSRDADEMLETSQNLAADQEPTTTTTTTTKGACKVQGRINRQIALLLGLARPSHKQMDARASDDLSRPVLAAGVLLRASSKTAAPKPCRCVLRGATLYYFQIAGTTGAASRRRRGEDRALDLRRVVNTDRLYGTTLRPRDASSFLLECDDAALRLGMRDDRGLVHWVSLTPVSSDRGRRRFNAAAWDDEAFRTPPATTAAAWRDAIRAALSDLWVTAEAEVRNLVDLYRRGQFDDSQNLEEEKKESSPSVVVERKSAALPVAVCCPTDAASAAVSPRSSYRALHPLNGMWQLEKRGTDLDGLLACEGISYSTRLVFSSAAAALWINLQDNRCIIYMSDCYEHRFAGPLDTPVSTTFEADELRTVFVVDQLSLTDDGAGLILSQSSPVSGEVFLKVEWRTQKRHDATNNKAAPDRKSRLLHDEDTLIQRTRWVHTAAKPYAAGVYAHPHDFDVYRRMPPDKAAQLELAVI